MKTDFTGFIRNTISSLGNGAQDGNKPWQNAPSTFELQLADGWPVKNRSVSWCIRKDGNIVEEGETGNLAELKDLANGHYMLAWAPARDILLSSISMPTKRKSRIEQALPYAMEDMLVKQSDDQHFTHVRIDDNKLAVAVINREKLSTWIDEFRNYKLPVRAILPLALGMPFSANSITAVSQPHGILLRTGMTGGVLLPSTDDSANATRVKSAIDQLCQERDISALDIYNMDPDTSWGVWHETLGIEIRSGHQPVLSILKPSICPVNMMSGDFTIHVQKESRPLERYKTAAIMAATGLLLLMTQQLVDAWVMSREYDNLNKAMISLYKQTFPDEKVIRDPYLQMQQKYSSRSGNGADTFIGLLGKATSLLQSSGNYTLATVSYNDNKLTINISLKDYAALDLLKNKAPEHGLAIEVLSASRRENQVAGRIRLSDA